MKNLIKTIVFFVLLAFSINLLGGYLQPKFDTAKFLKFYREQPKNSIDTLFIGDSGIYSDISPMQIYEDYGITSYNLATPAITNVLTYYIMMEALKTQSPSLVVMDATKLFGEKEKESLVHQVTDNMPLDDVKSSIINNPIYDYSLSDKISFLVPFFRYHDYWAKKSNSKLKTETENPLYLRGYLNFKTKKMPSNVNTYMENNGKTAVFKSTYIPEYLIKTKKYCDEHNIKFLLISMPDTKDWNYEKSEETKIWTEKNNIDYIDFNDLLDEIGIDYEIDSADGGEHLNISGSTKLSKYIGNYINEKYKLTDHRNDSCYSVWNEDVIKYDDLKKQNYDALGISE